MTYVIGYVVALLTFFLADMVWLGAMAPRFYRPTLGDIAISGVNLPPAIVFYAMYPIGLLIFAISPALRNGSLMTAAVYGALFGLFTYATYDLTNYATLRNWTLQLTVVDVAWGTILGAVTSTATVWSQSGHSTLANRSSFGGRPYSTTFDPDQAYTRSHVALGTAFDRKVAAILCNVRSYPSTHAQALQATKTGARLFEN